ncbi:MAG TPA: hypothetical protein VFU73_09510 [Actinocrinis sp.]|nr:hypothetical protein [Actinocrinis sp.]
MSTEEKPGAQQMAHYLRDLTRAARSLPRARRRELIEDVRSHIEVALAESGRTDADAVRGVLAALGDPGEIVAAAMPDEADPVTVSRGITGLEITTLVLLLFGAAAAGIGWLVGVLLLWSSPRWTRGEKLLGTLVVPGGLILPIVSAADLAGGTMPWSLVLLILGLAAPAITAVYLYQQARAAAVVDGTARWLAGLTAVGAVFLAVFAAGAIMFMASSQDQGIATPVTVSGPTSVAPTHSPS